MISRIQSFSRYITAVVFCFFLFTSLVTSANAQSPNTQLISIPAQIPNSIVRSIGGNLPSVSSDGSFVVYQDFSNRIFIRDRNGAAPVLVTRSAISGGVSSGNAANAVVSQNGNQVAFISNGNDLVDPLAFNTGNQINVYVSNQPLQGGGQIEAVSVPLDPTQPPNGSSFSPAISSTGQFVVFASNATNLVAETSGLPSVTNIYVRNRTNPPTAGSNGITLVSQINGVPFVRPCSNPAISDDGSKIVFESDGVIFLSDGGSVRPISQPDTGSAQFPAISGNGSVMAYQSRTNGSIVFVESGQFSELFINRADIPGGLKLSGPALNSDGSICAFASNLALISSNNGQQGLGFLAVYTFNRRNSSNNAFDIVSATSIDLGSNTLLSGESPSIDGSGQFVVFSSGSNLTTDDTNFSTDIYLRDRGNVLGGVGGVGGGSLSLIPNCPVGATAINSRQVDITWGAGQHNQFLEGHQLQLFRKDPDGTMKEITTVAADAVTLYSDTTVQPKTKYTYRAWIRDARGNGYAVDVFVKTKKEKK